MPVIKRQVNSLSKTGDTPLKGDVTLTGGTNVTLTQSGQDVSIAASGGTGDVVGPASSTDNAIVRYDGTTGKLLQDSSVTILDTGAVGIGTTAPGAALDIRKSVQGIGDEQELLTMGHDANWNLRFTQVYPSSSNIYYLLREQYLGTSYDTMAFKQGNVGIGTTSPTGVLHLKAGTATASTAPLKFTSGTNLTTPEAGTIEFDGTDFYLTA